MMLKNASLSDSCTVDGCSLRSRGWESEYHVTFMEYDREYLWSIYIIYMYGIYMEYIYIYDYMMYIYIM